MLIYRPRQETTWTRVVTILLINLGLGLKSNL